jgi:hypothetical protein
VRLGKAGKNQEQWREKNNFKQRRFTRPV